MAIKQSIWKLKGTLANVVNEVTLKTEQELEDIIEDNPSILNENWLVIGRQVMTDYNKYIDLLAIDQNGSLIIIELKKSKTPREVIAQGLDYASWVKDLSYARIIDIYDKYNEKYYDDITTLKEDFSNHFGFELDEENINGSHQIVIVAEELDSSTERIVTYLSDSKIPINVIFFKIFEDNDQRYISRAWMIDPLETSDNAAEITSKEVWNGEYYVSFGHGEYRNWDDAVKYGFIGAGGGQWYTRTLNQLKLNDRVWVNIPKVGYVGVGIVKETAKKADEMKFALDDSKEKNIYELDHNADYFKDFINNEDEAEYMVKVEWIKTVDINHAVSTGMFGNQNTVCKPRVSKWINTVNKLKEKWKIE